MKIWGARAAVVGALCTSTFIACDFTHADQICEGDGGRCSIPDDAGLDAGVDAGFDAGTDAGSDAGTDAGSSDCCVNPAACTQRNLLRSTVNPTQPQGIAVGPTGLYWLEANGNDIGNLWTAQTDGGGAHPIGATTNYAGHRLVLDSSYVTWVTSGALGFDGGMHRCLLDGGGFTTVVVDDKFMGGPAESSDALYWLENNVLRVLLADGGSQALASGLQSPVAIAADSNAVYLGQAGAADVVSAIQLSDGGYVTLASPHTVQDLTLYGAQLYWVDKSDAGAWQAFRAPTDGGDAQLLASVPLLNGENPQSIAVDNSGTYVTVGGGGGAQKVGRVLLLNPDGGAPTCLQSAQSNPFRLALDSQNIYWTDNNGRSVYSIPKP